MQDTKASRLFLVAAVVLGVLATVLAFVFIEGTASGQHGPQVPIVVAARDLKPSVALDPDRDFKVVDVPAAFSGLAGITLDAGARGAYRGQRLNRRVPAGQPVFLADIAAIGELTLAEPYRALTINASPGIVVPGDLVKIMVAHADVTAAAAGGADMSRVPTSYDATLVAKGQAFKVLAVGNSTTRTRQQVTAAEAYEASGGGANAKTVTLAVTEGQAEEILRAIGVAQAPVTLLLCPPAPVPVAGTNP